MGWTTNDVGLQLIFLTLLSLARRRHSCPTILRVHLALLPNVNTSRPLVKEDDVCPGR